MTAVMHKRTLFDAVIGEPLQLAIDQPPQLLISAASVYLVAAEAGILVGEPYNWLLAIGAEWAYLRGLSSGQAARTAWSARLIWAAVFLVIAYGSLWGLRHFGVVLPGEGYGADTGWSVAGAVLITAIHIGCISAVTLCSAMCHRAELAAERDERQRLENVAREEERATIERRAAFDLAQEEEDRKLARWKEAQRLKSELKTDAAMRPASTKMQSDAQPESINAAAQNCPKCGVHIESRSAWLAARRWQRCAACKETN
jgi:hypothetical protein